MSQTRLKVMLLEAGQKAHQDECLLYRKATEEKLDAIRKCVENMTAAIGAAGSAREAQHKQNIGTLKWQLRFSVGILLSVLGFLGVELFTKVFG